MGRRTALRTITFGIAGAYLASAGLVEARQAGGLRDILRGERASDPLRQSPKVAHYVVEAGVDFVLDRSGPQFLLKFDDSGEVWALQAKNGPRGDMNYLNDVGEVMLRVSRLGGLTVFPPPRSPGFAARLDAETAPLTVRSPVPSAMVFNRLGRAGDRIAQIVRTRQPQTVQNGRRLNLSPITLTAVGAGQDWNRMSVDAADVTVEAIERVAGRPGGFAALAPLVKVVIAPGRAPGVEYAAAEGRLTVVVTPELGHAGRPSSERIARAIIGEHR